MKQEAKQEFRYSDLPDDHLVTPADAARILAISASSLARWRSQGIVKPPFTKIGTWAVRYPLGGLRDYINDNRSDKAVTGGK